MVRLSVRLSRADQAGRSVSGRPRTAELAAVIRLEQGCDGRVLLLVSPGAFAMQPIAKPHPLAWISHMVKVAASAHFVSCAVSTPTDNLLSQEWSLLSYHGEYT